MHTPEPDGMSPCAISLVPERTVFPSNSLLKYLKLTNNITNGHQPFVYMQLPRFIYSTRTALELRHTYLYAHAERPISFVPGRFADHFNFPSPFNSH